jgi:hypothetical protein
VIYREGERLVLHRKKGTERLDLTRYLVAGEPGQETQAESIA